MKKLLSILIAISFAGPVLAAKKDFKGLFGSYQREKFTENEAHDSDWGVDLSLSTLLPVTSVVNSTTTSGSTGEPMRYSTFFNIEASVLFSLAYHWQLYASAGHYSYETRKENTNTNASSALFHEFEFKAVPVLLGARYRFGVEDIVPYVGLGVGFANIYRKGSYDSGPLVNEQTDNVIAAQALAGLEFYFSPRAGLRMEVGGYYFNCPSFTFAKGSDKTVNPDMIYQSNIFSVRYSSGLFFLF